MSAERIYCIANNTLADDFPDVDKALTDPAGLLAVSGGFDPELLLRGLSSGYFPLE